MSSFSDRIIRAAKLDVNLYEEVEADTTALGQAMSVVVLASVAQGIALISVQGINGLIGGTIFALIGWLLWAFITYFVGAKIIPQPQTEADFGQLLRTIGFSSAPGVLRVFGIIPGLQGAIFLITGIWMLIAMVIAVRQALDYDSTWRAVGVCIIGWLVFLLIGAFFTALFAPSPQQVM